MHATGPCQPVTHQLHTAGVCHQQPRLAYQQAMVQVQAQVQMQVQVMTTPVADQRRSQVVSGIRQVEARGLVLVLRWATGCSGAPYRDWQVVMG